MGDGTGISWTDATWNPVRGCSKVSPGCTHCYAERVAVRFSGPGQPYEGLADRARGRWTGDVRLIPEHLADPLRWQKPRRIFVNSMSDLFHEKLTNEEIAAVFGVMAAAPQHMFQVLTKRAKRMREWFEWAGGITSRPDVARGRCAVEALEAIGGDSRGRAQMAIHTMGSTMYDGTARPWPLPNVWIGVSVENQEAADERIPELLAIPAAVRFLSCEPLIGPVNLNAKCPPFYAPHLRSDRISWVIAGCESGPGARTCEVSWLRALRDQCTSTDVAFFLKQAASWPAATLENDLVLWPVQSGDGSKRKGAGVIELPYLDGVQHAAFPETNRGA